MKEVYKLRKRQPLGDKTSLLNAVPQCEELVVKLVPLNANTKTMNTRVKRNAVNKVSEMNENVKSTRSGRKLAVENAFKGKTKILKVALEKPKKIEEELSVKVVPLEAMTIDTQNNKNAVNKVSVINKNRKSTRSGRKDAAVVLKNAFKGKANILNVVLEQSDKESKTVVPTVQNKDTKPNLRRKPPKVYTEENSTIDPEAKQETGKGSGKVPIYKRQLEEVIQEPKKATTDLYEFTDVSPKQKKIVHPHRSSILFDKETYEILQKIEQKEVKAKKRKRAADKKKTYDDIMSNIVLNLKQKIVKKIIQKPQKEEHQEQNHDNSQKRQTSVVNIVPNMESNSSKTSLEHPQRSIIPEKSSQIDDHSITDDLDNVFGFEELPASTPMKPPTIRILSDIQLSKGININSESSIDFNVKRPNANSTMLNPNKSCSPWRLNWVNVRHNPHFLSLKPNALPRIDQEPVIEHTLVESFESGCQQTPKKPCESTPKKYKVQQSILDYIDSNIEKENTVMHGSLYDYEAFNSPVKSTKKIKKASEVARNLCPDENAPISSPLTKSKRCLTDITNNTATDHEVSYFGFDKSVEMKPKSQEDLPMRFDVAQLRKYPKTNKKVKFPEPETYDVKNVEDESFLDIPVNENVDEGNEEVHLFEEPEEMLANMSPPHEGKSRRKRLNSTDSDISLHERKRKRHKKTEAEIEQEQWIKEFNKMCDELEEYELEIE